MGIDGSMVVKLRKEEEDIISVQGSVKAIKTIMSYHLGRKK